MEGSCPTVVPLTGSLLERIQRSLLQQQRTGQSQGPLGQTAQQSRAKAPHQETTRAPVNITQPSKSNSQPEQVSLNLSQVAGQQHLIGQGSHTAISLQVLNSVPRSQPATLQYSYKVKIINPNRKSDKMVRHLHSVNSKFESVNQLRVCLKDEFQDHMPATTTFDIGYFEGKQQSKIWLVTLDDLHKMYEVYPKGGEVVLWCDSVSDVRTEADANLKRSKEAEAVASKRSQQEWEVESVYKELSEKHMQTWDVPLLKLWARCIVSGVHSDYDNPPDFPAFSGTAPKRARTESFSDAISGAAVAIVKALSEKETAKPLTSSSGAVGPGMSPSKVVDLRMKNFEQLRYLQQLYEDNILNENEYSEQKNKILATLRNIDF